MGRVLLNGTSFTSMTENNESNYQYTHLAKEKYEQNVVCMLRAKKITLRGCQSDEDIELDVFSRLFTAWV